MTNTDFRKYWEQGLSFDAYYQLLQDLMSENKTTGTNQSPEMIAYSQLNLQRMKRVRKTFEPIPALIEVMSQVPLAKYWLVLTEGWCGDAAQLVPAIHEIAEMNSDQITLRCLLRDEHPELMDNFLTNGGRSIPKVIFLDKDFNHLADWGPRPNMLQTIINDMRREGKMSFGKMVEAVHIWYANDKSIELQKEIAALLSSVNTPLVPQ